MADKKSLKSELPAALLKFAILVGVFAAILVIAAIVGGAEAVGATAATVAGVGIVGYLAWEVVRNLFFKRSDDR
jgi:hypothetical protein